MTEKGSVNSLIDVSSKDVALDLRAWTGEQWPGRAAGAVIGIEFGSGE